LNIYIKFIFIKTGHKSKRGKNYNLSCKEVETPARPTNYELDIGYTKIKLGLLSYKDIFLDLPI
jgi:hypothetical protein